MQSIATLELDLKIKEHQAQVAHERVVEVRRKLQDAHLAANGKIVRSREISPMLQIAIMNGETWLFCGGRTFADQIMFDDVMVRLVGMFGCPAKVVHGNAKGLDAMAAEWADRMAIPSIGVPADWATHGKAAGPIRNEDMLIDHKPKRVIAFPGGKGTADMLQRARNRRGEIEVIEIKPEVP